MSSFKPVLTTQQLNGLLAEAFPNLERGSSGTVIDVAPGVVRLRLNPTPAMGRPGGIVSGPTLMTMADHAAYAVVLAHSDQALMAVTHTLTMSFLRACQHAPITADAELMKLGRRLATIDVRVWQETERNLVAQSTVGYALPG